MSLELGFMYLIALGRGEVSFQNIDVPVSIDSYIQPEYSGYQQGSPFDFGFTSPLQTAPGTPLYGLETIGDIPEPNKPIYNEEGQLQAGSMNILNWSTGPTYTPPPLEFR